MESSHLLADIQHNCRFIAKMWGSQHDQLSYKVLTETIPATTASPKCYLDGVSFTFPGMISGIFGTSTYNSLKMAHIAAAVVDWLNGTNLDKYKEYYEEIYKHLKNRSIIKNPMIPLEELSKVTLDEWEKSGIF